MSAAIWHDLECGRYREDLALWCELADRHVPPGQQLLDVGAGTGRVALTLARRGHRVMALDRDAELLSELQRRADRLEVSTVCADARSFTLAGNRFPLIIVPMQTVQLFGGAGGRDAFLHAAVSHLEPGGILAAAITPTGAFEEFDCDDGTRAPLPDVAELDQVAYVSQPTAVVRAEAGFRLERRRELVGPGGERAVSLDTVTLDALDVSELVEAGQRAGLHPFTVLEIAPSDTHVASEVVVLRG